MRNLWAFGLCLAFSINLPAQIIRASIYGRVMDSTGSGVPGASVRTVHVATGTSYSFTTNASGDYDFPRLLHFGEYRIEAEAKGFSKLILEGITLVIDQRAKVDLNLRVGEMTQSVQVTAEAP